MGMPLHYRGGLSFRCHKNQQRRRHKSEVGEHVLLYNSHFRFFARKLLSKWEGPYIIEEVYRSGAIKINNAEDTNPKVVKINNAEDTN